MVNKNSNNIQDSTKNNHEILDKNHIKNENKDKDDIETPRDDETFSCNKTSFLLNQSSDNSFDRESLIKIFDKFNEII